MEIDMNFLDNKIDDIKKAMTSLIKRHKTIASATQAMLMGIAYEIEANNDATELNRFVTQLSDDVDGQVELSSTARAIGVYMQAMLPVKWVKKEQAFMYDEEQVIDRETLFEEAKKGMEAVRWDKFNAKKADQEFDADKRLAVAIGILKTIAKKGTSGELKADDPAVITANRYLKAA